MWYDSAMKWIDTHAHLNISAFTEDADAVAEKCRQEEVAVINIGTTFSTSERAVELAEQCKDLYAMVGLHPIQTVPGRHDEDELGKGGQAFSSRGEVFNVEAFRSLATSSSKVVGIGECGFDYYHTTPDSHAVQEEAFIAQIKLANELKLPLMIHTRGPQPGEASPTGRSVYTDVYEVLKQYATGPFNVHFYAGTYEEAARFFELGGTISFTGVITFAKQYAEIVQAAPLELIHAETDCPYVAPVPHRGRRCEPWMVKEVYRKIASLRRVDEEMVRQQLQKNAQRLYGLS